MANVHRIRSNFKSGTLGGDLLTTATTINFGSDPGFATLGTDEYLVIVIDPEGAGNGPEIVYLTAFTATNTTGTIERGKEGTSDPGLTHSSGTVWRHGPSVNDFDKMVVSTQVFEPSGDASVDIDISGFEHVRISGWMEPANDQVAMWIRLSNDGGSSFRSGAADYGWGNYLNGLTTAYSTSTRDGSDSEIETSSNVGNAAGEAARFTIDVINPADANQLTTILVNGVYTSHDANLWNYASAGVCLTAEVNDALQLLFSAGNIDAGRITVYGYPSAD